ncbi:MAG: hypothetical protein L3J33_08465 [Rhodobacteraceae bacterium]|nr:hypothetical protein [Paracoccaceae bacterium]
MKNLILIMLLITSTAGFAQEEVADPNADCREMHLVEYSFYSKSKLEGFLISELRANFEEFSVLNWDCIIQEFESQSERASVRVIPNGGRDGADVVRFKLDRSDSFLAVIASIGPGNSNGVFQAIFRVTLSGEIAVISRGGDARWLRLE